MVSSLAGCNGSCRSPSLLLKDSQPEGGDSSRFSYISSNKEKLLGGCKSRYYFDEANDSHLLCIARVICFVPAFFCCLLTCGWRGNLCCKRTSEMQHLNSTSSNKVNILRLNLSSNNTQSAKSKWTMNTPQANFLNQQPFQSIGTPSSPNSNENK